MDTPVYFDLALVSNNNASVTPCPHFFKLPGKVGPTVVSLVVAPYSHDINNQVTIIQYPQ